MKLRRKLLMFLLVFALAVQAPISAAAMSWDDLDWGDAATTEEAGGAGTEDSGNELNWDAPTTGFDIPGEEEAEDAAQEEPPLNFYEPMFGSTAATPFTEAPVKESPALVSEAPMMAGEGDSPLENFQGYGNSKVKMNSRDDVVQVPKDPEGFSYDNPVLLDITDDTIIELHDKEDGKDVCWVRNVGTYGGKAIDLKVTGLRDGEGIIEVSTRLFKEDGSTSNIELIRETNRNTYKTAGLPAAYPTKESEKGTLRGIWFAPGKNSFLLFEIYCDGALTPLTMALTLDDIDDSQTYTIYPLDGKVSKIYAREDTVVSMEVGTGSAVSGAPSLVTDRGYVKYYGGWNWPAYDPRFAATMDFVGMSSFVIYTTGSNIHEFAINSNDLLGGGIPTFEPPTATKHIYDSAGNLMDGKVLTAGQEYTYQITSDQPYLDAMTVVIEDELPAEVELVDFSLEETLYEDSTDVYQQGNKLKWVIYGVENTPDGEVVSVSVKVKAKNTAAVLVNKAQSFLFMPDDNPEEDGAIEESEESVVTNYIIIPVKTVTNKAGKDIDGKITMPGAEIKYGITVDNPTDAALTLTLKDVLPNYLDYISSTDSGVYDEDTRELSWTITIPAASSKTVTASAKVAQDAGGKILKNKATLLQDEKPISESNEVKTPVLKTPQDTEPAKSVADTNGADINEKVVAVDNSLIYTITVANPADAAKEFTITDKVPEGTELVKVYSGGKVTNGTIEWKITAEPYANISVSFEVKATTPGTVKNKATIAVDDEEFPTNEVTNYVVPAPVKAVTDTAGKDLDKSTVMPGDELVYTITVENPTESERVYTVTDNLPAGVSLLEVSDSGSSYGQTITWNLTLAAGASKTVTAKVKVNDDVQGATVENTATAATDNWTATSNPAVVHVPGPPQKQVTNASGANIDGGLVMPNEEIIYKITIKNPDGANDAVFRIKDALPMDYVTFVAVTDNGQINAEGVVSWELTLKGGESKTVGIKVRVKDTLDEDLINVAQVGLNDTWIDSNEVVNYPFPAPQKVVYRDGSNIMGKVVYAGDEIEYRITVENPSDVSKEFKITDKLDSHLTYLTSSDGGKHNSGTVTWTVSVPAGASKTVTVKAAVKEGTKEGTYIENMATCTSDNASMDTNKVTNKVAEYTFEAPTKAVYRGNNSIDGKTVTAGETLQYRITVKNPTGKALDFNITDKVDANLVFLRASDGGSHKNGTITWKVEVPANGSKTVTFDAVVGGSVPAGTVIQNTATMSVRNEKRDSNTVSNTVVLPPVPAAQTPATPASVVAHAVKYVKTGDNGIIILFAGLGIALLGGLGVYISKAKKKEE